MILVDWIAARLVCVLRGHDMTQVGILEQCRRCGKTWWQQVGSRS